MCSLYAPVYMMLGPFGLKISNQTEPLNGSTTAWKIAAWEDMAGITIWMDGWTAAPIEECAARDRWFYHGGVGG